MDKIVKKCDTSTTSEQSPAPSITQQPRSQATPAIHTDYQQSDYHGGQYQDAHYDQRRGYEHDQYPRNNYDDNYRGTDTYPNPQRWEEQRGDYRDDRRGRDYHRDEPRHYKGQQAPRDVNCDGRDGRYEDERMVRPVETNYEPESSFTSSVGKVSLMSRPFLFQRRGGARDYGKVNMPESSFTSSVGDSMINMPGPVFDAKQMKNMFGRQSSTPQKSNSDYQSHSFSHTPREKSSNEIGSRFDRRHSSTPSFGETSFSRNMYDVHASFDDPTSPRTNKEPIHFTIPEENDEERGESLTPQKSNSDDQSHSFSHTLREQSSDEIASRFDRRHSSTPSFGETSFSMNMYDVHASFDDPTSPRTNKEPVHFTIAEESDEERGDKEMGGYQDNYMYSNNRAYYQPQPSHYLSHGYDDDSCSSLQHPRENSQPITRRGSDEGILSSAKPRRRNHIPPPHHAPPLLHSPFSKTWGGSKQEGENIREQIKCNSSKDNNDLKTSHDWSHGYHETEGGIEYVAPDGSLQERRRAAQGPYYSQFWTCDFCSNDNKITSNTCEACQHKPLESHDKLTTTHRQLQTSYDNLMTTQRQLQKSHDTLKTTHHQLKKSHDSLVTGLQQKNEEISQLQKSFETLTTSNHQLQNAHDNLAASNHEKEEELLHLQETHQQLVQRFEQTQVELSAKQEEVTILQKKVTETENSWKISHKDIKETKTELGRGGWGVIWIGEFRGQRVAVKQMYELIRSDENLKILHREINTMSQLRHPNLLQFIGAVLDHPSGDPMIITEVMDTSLRKAYESKELTPDPSCRPVILSIMRDVAVGLNYLHCLPDPIIHRDISSANVLLESKGPRKWKTKISDFGSANFVRAAVTAATGALVYSAPESIGTLYRKKKDQTTKMDSYSYGVLLCEVITCQFPNWNVFDRLLQQVKTSSSKLYKLIVSCISEEPEKRPTISRVIEQLDS